MDATPLPRRKNVNGFGAFNQDEAECATNWHCKEKVYTDHSRDKRVKCWLLYQYVDEKVGNEEIIRNK